jgi:hypothetical protein
MLLINYFRSGCGLARHFNTDVESAESAESADVRYESEHKKGQFEPAEVGKIAEKHFSSLREDTLLTSSWQLSSRADEQDITVPMIPQQLAARPA